jgi:zinc protease
MMRSVMAWMMVVGVSAVAAWGQEATTRPATVSPATAPAEAQLKYAAERYRIVSEPGEVVAVLRNGMTIITKRVPSPVLTVRGYVLTGGIYEGKWLGGGLSHLLEHLVAGGSTEKRSEAENRELLQALGNNSNAYTTSDHTAYYINTTRDNLPGAVDLLTDWLMGAKITQAEYAREYEVVQRELEKGKGEPARQFYYLSAMNRYRVSPARVPTIGYQEVIQGLSRDDVYDYYKLAYVPNNMILMAVGDIDPEVALKTIQKHVDVPAGREFTRDIPAEPPVLTPRTVAATFPKLGQASLKLAFPSIRLDHPDLYALDLLSGVLGDGESSLLVEEIRDKRQLVSGISASNPTPEYVDGSFEITMRLAPDKIEETTQAVIELIEQVKRDGVSAERLERAKTQMKAGRIRSLQTSEDIAASLANDYMGTGDPHFGERYLERMMEVTPEQVQAMARKYLDPSRLVTTALLPAEYVGSAGLPKATDLLRPATPTTKDEGAPDAESKITRVELPNGAILLHKRISTTPLVYANMYSLGGLTKETAETNGIGSLTMSMLERGTTNRSAQQIAEFWDSIGGALGTAMGSNTWYWTMSAMKEDFAKAFEVYADVVNNPSFPADELEPMRQRTLAAIAGQDASWESQAFRFYREKFFGPRNSPYQFQAIGTRENVEKLSAEQLREWYTTQVLPARRVIAIFGDIPLEQARELATQHFGGGEKLGPGREMTAGADREDVRSSGPAVEVTRVEVQKTQQPLAGVVIGFETDSVIGADINYPLDVADTMTSGQGNPTGYLHETLRGQGLVYVVHAVNSPGQSDKLPGAFVVYAGTDPKRVNEVVETILLNIARVQGTEADMVEGWFERSKQLMLIGEAMERETAGEQATVAALDELYGLGYDHHLTRPDKIKSVTLDEVRRAAANRLTKAVVTISTPLPEQVKIEPGTRRYDAFPPVDLTPKGVQHDSPGGQ